MEHDFEKKDQIKGYLYRKYESEPKDCRGIMDYIDDGVGWSACSARDFSRHITSGGVHSPCFEFASKSVKSNGYCYMYFPTCIIFHIQYKNDLSY